MTRHIHVAAALGALALPAPDRLSAQEAAMNPIDTVRPDAPELASYGDSPVGVRQMTLTRAGVPDVLNATADSAPTYDRDLTVEIWYPAAEGTEPGTIYQTVIRDGTTPTELSGRASRDAAPAEGSYPLVIVSHGYPGNRFLMSPLAENLASKGYVVASIDHTDSTYSDQAAFGSTLLNRPQDQAFVLDELAAMEGDLGAIIDGETVGLVCYSMGGYGALIFAGAGVTEASVGFDWAPPGGLLAANQAGSETHEALVDDRLKAVVAFAPWGMNAGFWDEEGLSGIDKPLMMIAGSVDDVSVYADMRRAWEGMTGTDRHLLTFEGANHNAGAPMPAPQESYTFSEALGWYPFEHYADAVWDNVRMNNVSVHFVTAFLDQHLKGADTGGYLDLVPAASEGVWSMGEDGAPAEDHTYWAGFPERTAVGLRFETLPAGE